MNLTEKVKKVILRENLFSKGDKLVVAVSGGPDSVCLLDILVRVQKEFNFDLVVAHFNHGLRKEADTEAKFVKNLAKAYGLEFFYQKAKEKPKSNIEDWAREQRYYFLGQVAFQNKAKYVVVAHTADDQIETVLMNALRGSGLAGLVGMRLKSDFQIKIKNDIQEKKYQFFVVRPFLDVWREEIEDYLFENNLNYIIDKSNFDLRFTRNQIRHQLIPLLVKENPNFKKLFLKKIKNYQKNYQNFLEKIEKIFEETILEKDSLKIKFSWERFLPLSDFEKSEIIRLAIRKIKGNVFGFERVHIEEIIELVNKKITGKKKIFKNLIFENQKDGFLISQIN